MLHNKKSSVTVEEVWSILRKSKSVSFDCTNIHDSTHQDFYALAEIQDQLNKVETQLQSDSNADTTPIDDISDSTLELAAEMFLYLNGCLKPMKSWVLFYQDLFENQPPDVIVLKLNRILKGENMSPTNNNLKSIASKLFRRVTSLFHLKYKEIQNVTKGSGDSSLTEGIIIMSLKTLIAPS